MTAKVNPFDLSDTTLSVSRLVAAIDLVAFVVEDRVQGNRRESDTVKWGDRIIFKDLLVQNRLLLLSTQAKIGRTFGQPRMVLHNHSAVPRVWHKFAKHAGINFGSTITAFVPVLTVDHVRLVCARADVKLGLCATLDGTFQVRGEIGTEAEAGGK